MGVKRPLEEVNLQELSFEHPKQLDNNKKLAYLTEDFPSHATGPEVDSPGKSHTGFCLLHSDGALESDCMGDSFIADKKIDTIEKDVGIKNSSFLSNFQHYIDFVMPYRPPNNVVDPYIYFLSVPSKKEIPIGQDYQAEVPKWDPANNSIDNYWESEQKFMGSSITLMPSLNDYCSNGFSVGRGRITDCNCIDMGSIRCVQQHAREAREKLRDSLGDETFTKLGFCEMGEEIGDRWSSMDQRLFHDIVCSNSGGDFWKNFGSVFPNRTKKELVNYYFNVFVLRRRAAQNRAYMSQIDSDHEELNVVCEDYPKNRPLVDDDGVDDDLYYRNGDFVIWGGEEDLEVESLISDKELDMEWVDEFGSEPEIICGVDEGRIDNNGTFDGNAVKEDGFDEGRIDNHGTCDGNAVKEDGVDESRIENRVISDGNVVKKVELRSW